MAKARSQWAEAHGYYEEGLGIARQLAEQLQTPATLRDLAVSCHRVGAIHGQGRHLVAQKALFAEMVQLLEQVARQVDTPQARQELEWARQQLAQLD